MLVLVTGATGRIGVHLTRELRAAGHTVRAFTLPGDPRASLIAGEGVEFVEGRLQDPASLKAAATGVEAVYHLAGALTSRGNTDQEFFDFNLKGTYDLLCAVRDHAPGVRRFAYASSDAVYMAAPERPCLYTPIDEDHPRQPASIYGATKAAAEELCHTFMRAYGIPVTILRFSATADAEELTTPGSVFSRWIFTAEAIAFLANQANPTPEQTESLDILRSLHDGTPDQLFIHTDLYGNSEVRHWGDARDVAAGCLLALENRLADGETFNLAGPAPFATIELIAHLAQRTGYPVVTAPLPMYRAPWKLSNARARSLIGYEPRYDVFAMIDQATGGTR
jgi:UDP-glucose 4-epimerase